MHVKTKEVDYFCSPCEWGPWIDRSIQLPILGNPIARLIIKRWGPLIGQLINKRWIEGSWAFSLLTIESTHRCIFSNTQLKWLI